MAVCLLDRDLESLLAKAVESAEATGFVNISAADPNALKQLEHLGLIEDLRFDYSLNATANVTYKGRRYFEDKDRAIVAGVLLDDQSLSLLESAIKGSKSGTYFWPADMAEDAIEKIRAMGRSDLLKTDYADDVPWASVVTERGKSAYLNHGVLPAAEGIGGYSMNNVTINGNASEVQIQNGVSGSGQFMANVHESVSDGEVAAAKLVLAACGNVAFDGLLGQSANAAVEAAETVVSEEEEPSLRKKAVSTLRKVFAEVGVEFASKAFFTFIGSMVGVQ